MRLGVIVGRFQTPYLHTGHVHLIDTALSMSDEVLIILGCTTTPDPDRNPYSYSERAEMIRKSYPNVTVGYIFDIKDDNIRWSKVLDEIIHLEGAEDVTLFGSRDSFIDCYLTGTYKYHEVSEIPGVSATNIRNNRKKGLGNEIF